MTRLSRLLRPKSIAVVGASANEVRPSFFVMKYLRDKRNVPNAKNLTPQLRHPKYDPNRNYTLPWQTGPTGIGYNIKETGREIRSTKELRAGDRVYCMPCMSRLELVDEGGVLIAKVIY